MSEDSSVDEKLKFKLKKNLCVMGVAFMCIMSSFNGLKVLEVGVLHYKCHQGHSAFWNRWT